jgi:hypothetical protein
VNLQTDTAQLFLFDPIPAKAKKLGLLSIYKFSLRLRTYQINYPPQNKNLGGEGASNSCHKVLFQVTFETTLGSYTWFLLVPIAPIAASKIGPLYQPFQEKRSGRRDHAHRG